MKSNDAEVGLALVHQAENLVATRKSRAATLTAITIQDAPMTDEIDDTSQKVPSPEFVREIIARGETYLQAQLTLATSADQRGASMAAIFSPVALAIFAGLLAADETQFSTLYWPLIISGAITGFIFLLASALCGFAVHPVPFNLPGTQPKSWTKDINAGEDENKSLFGLAKNFQEKIDRNRTAIARNARLFKWGLRCGIGAPAVGVLLLLAIWLGQHFCLPVSGSPS